MTDRPQKPNCATLVLTSPQTGYGTYINAAHKMLDMLMLS
jgi:hypothetical protein